MELFDQTLNPFLNDLVFKAILLMAGEGDRLNRDCPKQFLPLGSKKVYQWSLETLIDTNVFKEIILVCHPDYFSSVEKEISVLARKARLKLIMGGSSRQSSVYKGLKACGGETDFVLIHDSARPFVSHGIIQKNLKAVMAYGACNTCIPAADTLVSYPKEGFSSIPNRKDMWQGQTPQTFRYEWIKKAHEHFSKSPEGFSDDCQLILREGYDFALVQGSEDNRKITTPWDWHLAQWIAQKHEQTSPL